MRHFRPLADGALLFLATLVAGSTLALLAFVASQALPHDPFVACQTLATTLLARAASLGLLLPAALLAASLLAGLLALLHQFWATRRMLGPVLAARRPLGARLDDLGRSLDLQGRLDVIDDPSVFTFCYGLIRPRVCLSQGLAELLDEEELRAVLAHEAHHLRHRDPLKIFLGRSLASALFFLPLAGGLRNTFLAGKELSADAAACRAGGELPLASALLKMLGAERPIWPAGVLAIGAMSPTEARLRQLLEQQPLRPLLPSPRDWALSAAVVAGIFGFAFGSAAAAQAAPLQTACSAPSAFAEPFARPVESPESASILPMSAFDMPAPTDELLEPPSLPRLLPHDEPCDLLCTPSMLAR